MCRNSKSLHDSSTLKKAQLKIEVELSEDLADSEQEKWQIPYTSKDTPEGFDL